MEDIENDKRIQKYLFELDKKFRKTKSEKLRMSLLDDVDILFSLINENDLDLKIPYTLKDLEKFQYDNRLYNKKQDLIENNYNTMFKTNYEISSLYQDLEYKYGYKIYDKIKNSLTFDESIELAEKFFESYDKDIYKFLEYLKDNNYIYKYPKSIKNDTDYSYISGATYPLKYIGQSYIFVRDTNDISCVSTIIHETIHAYLFTFDYKNSYEENLIEDINNLYEVYTEFIEILFLEYLKKSDFSQKDIDTTGTNINYVMINQLKEFNKILSKDKRLIIDNESEYNYYKSVEVYVYGKILARHYLYEYFKNPNKTKDNLTNLYIDSKKYDKHYLLNNYGLKENNLKKPKVLLKHMKENYHY